MLIHDLALAGHSDKMVLAKSNIKCWFNGMLNQKLSLTLVSRFNSRSLGALFADMTQ